MKDSVHGANIEEETIMTTVNRKWSQNVSMPWRKHEDRHIPKECEPTE